jgi:hypothetical protein
MPLALPLVLVLVVVVEVVLLLLLLLGIKSDPATVVDLLLEEGGGNAPPAVLLAAEEEEELLGLGRFGLLRGLRKSLSDVNMGSDLVCLLVFGVFDVFLDRYF